MTALEKVNEYARLVRSGELPSCEMVRKAVGRWGADWQRNDIYFDSAAFTRFVKFSKQLKHYKGAFAGKPIAWEPWQLFCCANIFGWKYRDTGLRRFTYADVYVPRKNGKTTFAAVIALYMLLFDNESAAEVYAAAVDREQAKICFNASVEIVKAVQELEGYVRFFRNGSLVVEDTASLYKPLSKDTQNKDGLNIHCAICDERHAWKTNEIYEVLKTGVGARSQPLIFSISTAGTDTAVPYYRDLDFLRQVMNGVIEKDNHFIMLYEPDEGDAWDDPNTWAKVNPNLGVSLGRKYMEDECHEAKEKGGTTLAAFKTKNLNMWVDAPAVWIPDTDVAANNESFDLAQLAGDECYVGIDFARKTDIVATAFFFPKHKVTRLLYIVPEAKVQGTDDRVDYRKWAQQGWIVQAPGNVTDEDWFIALLFQELDRYNVKAIAYDPWGMWNVLGKFGKYQERLMEYPQSIKYMSVPAKWLESAVLKHELNFLGDPVIRWMFSNVVIYTDPNLNIKLDRARSRNKIDGVVATVDAVGAWLTKTGGKTSEIYTTHTLRTVRVPLR